MGWGEVRGWVVRGWGWGEMLVRLVGLCRCVCFPQHPPQRPLQHTDQCHSTPHPTLPTPTWTLTAPKMMSAAAMGTETPIVTLAAVAWGTLQASRESTFWGVGRGMLSHGGGGRRGVE